MFDQYLNYLSIEGKSTHTIKAYRAALAHFEQWYQQSYDQPPTPAIVTPRDVRDWSAFQQTVQRASPRSINQRLAALRQFFNWCIEQGLAQTNPASTIKSQKLPRRQPQALSESDTRKLLKAADISGNKRDVAILQLMLRAGLRREEVLNLRLADVELGPRSGRVFIRYGKGGKYREVPLPAEVRNDLRAYLDSLKNLPLAPNDSLWRGQRGPLSDPWTINEIVRKYAYQAHLNHITPHQLRHTFATRFLEENPGDLRALAAILGHSSLDTVMIYTEPTTEALAEKMERVT